MTTRELWRSIMQYRTFDRMPVIHWSEWAETRERWHREGLPQTMSVREFLGADPHWAGVGVNMDLFPAFSEEIVRQTAEYRIVRGQDGVLKQEWKTRSCIPHFIDFTLKSARDWPEYKKRLQPDAARIPPDLDDQLQRAEASGCPVVLKAPSLMGWIRNWMGVENMSYLMYDDPDCYAEMVDTLASLGCWTFDQVIPRMKEPPDMAFGWEDICGKSGPLVSPAVFERAVAPGYRRMRSRLAHYGVDLLGVDCDGLVEPLLRHWLDAGVNVQLPIEIGTWNADPYELRRRFGKELRIIGGFNKLALEQGPAAIDAEIARRLPLMKEGGFVLLPDHLITPGTSLDNYRYYLHRVRELRF